MNSARFNDLTPEEQDWLDTYLDGTIEPDDFASLQDRMLENPALREVMRRYLALDSFLQNESLDAAESPGGAASPWLDQETPPVVDSAPAGKIIRFPKLVPIAAAAGLAFLLGTIVMQWTSRNDGSFVQTDTEEPSAQGFAVLERLFEARWPENSAGHREGTTLGAEVFQLASGTAEIQFFSGATMTVEGPAEILLRSAWEADCREGSVRMQVPPAARGFKLQAPSTEIIDLGTEFGLKVRDGKGHVEVFDGEIEVRHEDGEKQLVTKGHALGLLPDQPVAAVKTGEVNFPNRDQFDSAAVEQQRSDFERWTSHRDSLARDDRLIAYYTFDKEGNSPLIPNLTLPPKPGLDGAIILAEPVAGRWPELKSALEFRRPGSRVRVNIPGEYPAFTFACWVRIDSLDRWYNALFMGDGYETGEPHWQIKNTGQMMLSVMVDDSKPNPGAPNDAGFHRVYYSPPMWDLSMSGQWMHLASVFDPMNREVCHYVNGKQIHHQEIEDRFFIETLRIGNAEIGNWGRPFREDPTWAIRNLNGRMDELAIFQVALSPPEIARLYEQSRSERR
ncbi:MAG: FecR domain-containing protein [Verrucomicrobiales bacterium]|nr:FecR domain-containing protein [Verrucomicrobiales bacterium]